MRLSIPVVFVCLLSLSFAVYADGEPPRIEVKEIDETPRGKMLRQVTEKLLKQELPKLEWEGAGLSEVLADFAAASGITFEIQWASMELVGIDQDSLVDCKTDKRTLPEILNVILEQVSADAFDDDRLGYAIRDGNIVISTKRETNKITVRRAYNIGALVREPYRPVGMYFSDEAFEDAVAYHAWIRGERGTPLTDAMLLKIYKYHHEKQAKELAKLDPANEVEGQKPADHGGGLFGDDVWERGEPNEFVQPAIEELIELIKTNVALPEYWLDELYEVHVSGDILVINAPVPVQDDLKRLLDILLQAEIDRQASMLKDAHASKQVALANACLTKGDKPGAMEHVSQALWIMPDHVPANAMKKLLASIADKPKPVN